MIEYFYVLMYYLLLLNLVPCTVHIIFERFGKLIQTVY